MQHTIEGATVRLVIRRLAVTGCGAAVALAGLSGTAGAAQTERSPGKVEDRYIVLYEREVARPADKTNRLERAKGFDSRFRYARAVKGFAARLSAKQVDELRADPGVALVSPDRPVHALGTVPVAGADNVPTGVRRMEAGTATTARRASTANVAVIDTGIDLGHPDLNAADGRNCVSPGTPARDDDGHGTHVAGTIGARNDGAGVVGVAPGTRTYAVKVLDGSGTGSYSQIICGIDWVTSTLTDGDPANDISVANMSLGGAGARIAPCATTTDPMHRAICASSNAGVTYVVAAGNEGWDFDYAPAPDTPAAYPEALTVTAMSDSDGRPGATGGAPSCTRGEGDDRAATFSNFASTSAGAAHAIAGPGVCINSTWPGGGHASISGTSMAAPHVAGAVALCLGEGGVPGSCAGLPPPQIIQKMRADAQAHTSAHPAYGFTGDPVRPFSGAYFGHLARAPAADSAAPTVSAVSPADGAAGVTTATSVNATFSEPMDTAATAAAFRLERVADGAAVTGAFAWNGNTLTFRPSSALAADTQYRAFVSTGARDLAGNAMTASRAWTFKTAITTTLTPASTTIQSGSLRSGGFGQLGADDNLYFEVNSTATGTRTAAWYGRFAGVSRGLLSLRVLYRGRNSLSCAQTVSIWRPTTGTWVQLDARSVGTTEVLVDRSAGGTLADYVSTGGTVNVRVRCTSSSASFHASADQLSVITTRP